MGNWIEFRCEDRNEDGAEGASIDDRCWSMINEGPMCEARDNRQDLIETMRYLEESAKHSGWQKFRSGWVCPCCVVRRNQPAVRGAEHE